MALILKQSTAVDVLIGPFVDVTDGASSEVGESPSVKLSKNGQALAAKNDGTTPAHDADGYYNCELDATDTNTVGQLVATIAKSATALPVRHEFYVVEEATYDFLYAAGATPMADIADAVWDETMAGHTTADTAGLVMNEWQDAGRLDAILDEITTNVDAIETDTQDLQTQIGTAGAGLTNLGAMSTAMKAEILVEVNAALDTAISELGVAAPTATPTIRTGLMLLYMALRNKTVVQTSGTDALEIHNNAGTKIAAKLLTDDGSDYTEAEMA